jgi:hypothetical protein
MKSWFKEGATNFGFVLELRREPLIHAPRGFRHDANTHREFRTLIPELTIRVLQATFQMHKRAAGRLSVAQASAMLAFAERRRRILKLAAPQHGSDSSLP